MKVPARPLPAPSVVHFGEKLRSSWRGHRLTREMYAYPSRSPKQVHKRDRLGEALWESLAWAYRDEDHRQHSDMYLAVQRFMALVNYELSMRFFDALDKTDFERALQAVLSADRRLKPVTDLATLDEQAGAYVMVFDDIKQMYIGESGDLRKRIKQHWTARKPFDRLIHGSMYTSVFPVDELLALDNTRLFALKDCGSWDVEEKLEEAADPRFTLNRRAGGEPTPMMLTLSMMSPRTANLVPDASAATEEEIAGLARAFSARVESAVCASRAEGVPLGDRIAPDPRVYVVEPEVDRPEHWSEHLGLVHALTSDLITIDEFNSVVLALGFNVIAPPD